MNRIRIRHWLEITSEHWPPDHYTLLGLEPGARDIPVIEQRVRERMERVRRYQLSYPEEATESMNRLAQALVCLTDPVAKKAYDESLTSLQSVSRTVVDYDTAPPPPLNGEPVSTLETPRVTPQETPGPPPTATKKTAPAPILYSAPADPVFETARSSRAARRGLGTRRALYYRLAQTRRLQRAWDRAGCFCNQPTRQLARAAEELDLVQQLTVIRELSGDFPAFFGRPGTPGQHIVCIARQSAVAQTFRMLDLHQRAALAQDWMAGRTLLAQHRQFIRQEIRAYRTRSWLHRKVRAVRAALNDHPRLVILGVGCVAVAIALFHWLTGSYR
jgi:hypothetical protein